MYWVYGMSRCGKMKCETIIKGLADNWCDKIVHIE